MNRIVRALQFSFDGISWAARWETSVRHEIFVLAAAVPLGLLLAANVWQLLALVGVIVLVLIVELLNTAIEKLADRVSRQRDPAIKAVKDMGSAAVFLTLVLAGLVWLVILLQYRT